jgi:hypothetical protein
MPQLQKNQAQSGKTATTIKENRIFRDRLRDRYKPEDYVRVINIDNEPFEWQWFPTTGESTYFTDNGAVRVTEGRQGFTKNYESKLPGNEQQWVIDAGDSEVIIGENADLMIEGLYKRLVAKDKVKKMNVTETQARSFNWNDGLMQEEMIDKIFLGIETPNFNEPIRSETTTKK